MTCHTGGVHDPPDALRLDRSLRRYPLYAGLLNTWFWMPVFFLYFAEHLSLAEVLRLEAIYYIAVVILEVPSGSFSDRVGRRPTLIISAVSLTAAYALFFVAPELGFAAFVIAQVLLAAGIAFNSGTDVSFHYDALAAVGRETSFDDREASVARICFLSTAGAAIVGGTAAMVNLRAPYALSALSAIAGLFVVIGFVEPPRHTPQPDAQAGVNEHAPSFAGQLRACVGDLRHPRLAWLGAVSIGMVVLNHVPYEFVQPYTQLLTSDGTRTDPSPLILGVHATLISLIAAAVAGRSIWVRERLGLRLTMLSGVMVQTTIIVSMAIVLHPLILGLVMFRGVSRALMTAPMNAAVAPLIPSSRRATYLSGLSLAGRLSFSGLLLLLSRVAEHGASDGEMTANTGADDAHATWEMLQTILSYSATVGLIMLAGLLLTGRAMRSSN
ncbi:MAG: MFS transporter [Phycisphaerales bacterium]